MHAESVQFTNVSGSQQFQLVIGGVYAVAVVATFGGGSVKLQKLAADGSTYVDLKVAMDSGGVEQDDVVGTFSANGDKTFMLSPGAYQLTIATATAVYASISRAPLS